jgi:hypothetical protein
MEHDFEVGNGRNGYVTAAERGNVRIIRRYPCHSERLRSQAPAHMPCRLPEFKLCIPLLDIPVVIAVPHVGAETLHILGHGSLDVAVAEEGEAIFVTISMPHVSTSTIQLGQTSSVMAYVKS